MVVVLTTYVALQEDTMSEARQIETEAATYLDQMSRYFLTRGKIVSKVAKYPHVVSWLCLSVFCIFPAMKAVLLHLLQCPSCIGMLRINGGWHLSACHRHIYPQMKWDVTAFTLQPQTITALWFVLFSHSTELAWLDGWFGCPKIVTHPGINRTWYRVTSLTCRYHYTKPLTTGRGELVNAYWSA